MLKIPNLTFFKFGNYFYRSRYFCNLNIFNKPSLNDYAIKNLPTHVSKDILSYIKPHSDNLVDIINYSFNASGKMIRPQIIIWFSAVLNEHFLNHNSSRTKSDNIALTQSQYHIALIAEMIHTASLMHDDLIDRSSVRRGLMSTHVKYGSEKAILGGDYIIIKASQMLAKIGNCEAVSIIAELINDLIKGEIMQLSRYDDIDEQFAHYYKKTYRKTASLIANTCKAVCLLSTSNQVSESSLEAAFEFGRNLGMTFQLVDDILDVTSSQDHMGKPCQMADIKLGLATGPVLFASEKFPEVREIVVRKLSKEGDFEKILGFIEESKGVQKTRLVARTHYDEALRILQSFRASHYRNHLQSFMEDLLIRTK